jgi:hypothetical protein
MRSPPLTLRETNLGETMVTALAEPLDRALALLGAEPPWLRVREAEHLLREVEARLGELGTSHGDHAAARRLLELRDDLSSHLRAASICATDDLPPALIAHLLRRGARLAQREIVEVGGFGPS